MKIIRVSKDAHNGVKIEAAKAEVTTSEMASHLLIEGVALLRQGKMVSPKKGGQS